MSWFAWQLPTKGTDVADKAFDLGLTIGARRILAAKFALRDSLPLGYVSDPAVILLLTLLIRGDEPVSHSELSATIAPASTSIASRWLKALEADGLVACSDGETSLVSLTPLGRKTVETAVVAISDAERRVRVEMVEEPDEIRTIGTR